jgi:hypothetical protein
MSKKYQARRRNITLVVLLTLFIWQLLQPNTTTPSNVDQNTTQVQSITTNSENALNVLGGLAVKGRAPKTDYKRSRFGDGWLETNGCDTRNLILARDLVDAEFQDDGCTVVSGTLNDPYTNNPIDFMRGVDTSDKVQIDHVVALSDAWQKGAQLLSSAERERLANDPLNLLAVDGQANQDKSDSDAASWLPPNKSYRCQYVARQIAVKDEYQLWITDAEKNAMRSVLSSCPDQLLPIVIHEE